MHDKLPPFFELSSILKSIIVNARICLLSFLGGEIPVGQTKTKILLLLHVARADHKAMYLVSIRTH